MAGVYAKLRPLGYFQDTTIDAASTLGTIPAGASRAMIKVAAQAARWRDDGVDPTAAIGMPLAVGEVLNYDGNLNAFRIISSVAGSELNVAFFGF